MAKKKKTTASLLTLHTKVSSKSLVNLATLQAEKCELKDAYFTYMAALDQAYQENEPSSIMECLAGLLRLSSEALDSESIEKWDNELDRLIQLYPKKIPPMTWYCKGAVARHRGQYRLAQRNFHRYLKSMKRVSPHKDDLAKGWLMLATVLQQRGHSRRAGWLAQEVLKRYESRNIRGINGTLYLLLGLMSEKKKEILIAKSWYQKAHAQFLGEHNWYYYLYVIYAYARLARLQNRYSEASWHLDIIEKAASSSEFGLLKREVHLERKRLEQDKVDIVIDSRKGIIKTREYGQVSIRKQFVLLHILEALSQAEKGLSKAEIIEHVWKESYKPETHDNKLYYNINRLRKLIEPNVKKPQYLINWKEGYRLAPGLRIQHLG